MTYPVHRFGAMLEEFEVVDAMDYTIAARYGPAAVAALRQEKYNSGRAPAVLKQQYNNSQMYNSGFSS